MKKMKKLIKSFIFKWKCFLYIYFDWTPLHFACYVSELETVKLLLAKSDDILNSQDNVYIHFI